MKATAFPHTTYITTLGLHSDFPQIEFSFLSYSEVAAGPSSSPRSISSPSPSAADSLDIASAKLVPNKNIVKMKEIHMEKYRLPIPWPGASPNVRKKTPKHHNINSRPSATLSNFRFMPRWTKKMRTAVPTKLMHPKETP